MTGRFSRAEAVSIFGVLFCCCLAFFLLGVYAGRTFFVPSPLEPVASLDPAPAAAPQDLDFYSGLVDSGGEGSEAVKPSATERSEDSAAGPPPGAADTSGGPSEREAETEPAGSAEAPRSAASSFWTVQVGALDTAEEARMVILRLEAKGYSARLVDPAEGGGRFHRVWVGQFRDEAAARRFEERLKADGFHTYAKKVEAAGPPR